MAKKDNIISFRDYQPGKRETIETHDLDTFRETLYDLGFLGPSSSDTLDETEEVEVEPETEVEETEAVEEPTVEVEVEETTDPVTEEETSEADDESEGESMVEETEPDDEPEVLESEADDDLESDDEEEPEIVDEDDSDDDDFLSEDNEEDDDEADFLSEYDEEDDDEEIKEEPDKFKAPEGSLSDLIIKETERGFDSDEPLVEDDDSDEEIEEAEFKEVDSNPEEDSSEFEEEPPVSRRRHKHAAPSGAGARFFKKLGSSFANSLLSNFGLGETPAVQPSKADDEESKAEDSATKAEFNSKAQEIISKEIMGGKVDKLKEWSQNDNVNKLMFLFSGNSVLSDWIMENEPDIFWDLPDEIIDVILEKNKKSSEKKDDKDEKKS